MVSKVMKVWRWIMGLLEGGDSEISESRKYSRVSRDLWSHSCSSFPTPHLSDDRLSLKSLAPTASLVCCSFPGKSRGAMSSSFLPQPCSPPVQPPGWREAGVQGWVLLCCGEEKSWDVGIKQRPQLCCCWQGCPHAGDNPSLGSGSSAGTWWLFRLGWVFLISLDTK